MTEKTTGGPAFPGPYVNENGALEALWKQGGMTLRDYFAAKALQGLLAMERSGEYFTEEGVEAGPNEDGTLFAHTEFIADEAYSIADRMLAARRRA